ncbi:MAG TPA: hypothetical protein VKB35_15425, partial [Ktedonobacteraceae bacterium]|nr:hypothetical protein [Ktedonobacteraceae bacterium]
MRKVPLTSFLDAHLAMAAPPRFSFGIASSTTFPAWVSPVYLAELKPDLTERPHICYAHCC